MLRSCMNVCNQVFRSCAKARTLVLLGVRKDPDKRLWFDETVDGVQQDECATRSKVSIINRCEILPSNWRSNAQCDVEPCC